MVDFTPLPAEPTPADLAAAIAQLHTCLDSHAAAAAAFFTASSADRARLAKGQLALERQIRAIAKSIEGVRLQRASDYAAVTAELAAVKTALGVDAKRKPVGQLSQLRLVLTLFTIITAAGGVLKFVEFSWPYAWRLLAGLGGYLMALNHWMVK